DANDCTTPKAPTTSRTPPTTAPAVRMRLALRTACAAANITTSRPKAQAKYWIVANEFHDDDMDGTKRPLGSANPDVDGKLNANAAKNTTAIGNSHSEPPTNRQRPSQRQDIPMAPQEANAMNVAVVRTASDPAPPSPTPTTIVASSSARATR